MKYISPFADLFEDKKKKKKKKEKPKGMRVRFEIALDSKRDKEIIAYLDTLPNKSEYIRRLVREDIDAL